MIYFNYHSTNCFFIKSTNSSDLLSIDAGWPCTLYEYQKCMKSIGLSFKDLKYSIVTHFHMDHAGLISEFIESGITVHVTSIQYDCIDEMERIIRKNYKSYKLINKTKIEVSDINSIESCLLDYGFPIHIIETNGHSDDSISVLEKDSAIIGDLYPIDQVMEDDIKSILSWKVITGNGIKHIYPSHAEVFDL
jgi:Zn-dependent hydrolases, including glyoxylases